jgi:transcriptional regulator with XRE-family HTH domain
MNQLALQLKNYRLQLNLTQRGLSAKADVAYGTLRKLEATGTGSLTDFVKLLKALEMWPQLAALGVNENAQNAPQIALMPRRRARKHLSAVQSVQTPFSAPQGHAFDLKSKRLGLSFPYDWSNPDIDDAVLIAKVLDKARFTDVSRTIAYFGLNKVEQIAARFGIALDSGPLGAVLPTIRIAQAAHDRMPHEQLSNS